MQNRLFLLLLTVLISSSCAPKIEHDDPSSGNADLSTPMFMGGTWLSGYRDGALFDEGINSSVSMMLSEKFREAESGNEIRHALMGSETGLGLNTGNAPVYIPRFQNKGVLGKKINCDSTEIETTVLREKFGFTQADPFLIPTGSPLPHNLSIPYANTSNLLDQNFGLKMGSGGINAFYHRIASAPGSSTVLNDAMSHDPSFFVFNPGFEDVFNYAFAGAEWDTPLNVSDFRTKLDSMLIIMTANNAQGVLATIPPLNSLPFFTTVPPLVELDSSLADSLNTLYLGTSLTWIEGDNGFIINDPTTADGFRHLDPEEYILLSVPLDSMKCYNYGTVFTLIPDWYVLMEDEIAEIEQYIADYNMVIRDLATQHNLALTELHSFMQEVESGYMYDGVKFTSEFVAGGFFSVDGQNPTAKGAALLSNEFIRAINAHYNSNIATVLVHQFEGVRFP